MSEINIAGAIDKLMIYDDPEYCCGEFIKDGFCYFLETDNNQNFYCSYFREDKTIAFTSKKLEKKLFDHGSWGKAAKCDQCKDAYRKAVNEKLFDEEKQYTPDGP